MPKTKIKAFPKKLYLTYNSFLSDKPGCHLYHSAIFELVEEIQNRDKLNDWITLFKLNGEIEEDKPLISSKIGRELIIQYKYNDYINSYNDLIPGKVAIYRCVALDSKNPFREEINKKAKETREKHKNIYENSKIINWMGSKKIYVNKESVWNLIKDEISSLNIKMKDVSIEVTEAHKDEE